MYNQKNTMSNPADDILNSFGIQSDGPAAFSNPNGRISPSTPDRYGLGHGGKSHRRKARKAAKKSKRSRSRSKRSKRSKRSS